MLIADAYAQTSPSGQGGMDLLSLLPLMGDSWLGAQAFAAVSRIL